MGNKGSKKGSLHRICHWWQLTFVGGPKTKNPVFTPVTPPPPKPASESEETPPEPEPEFVRVEYDKGIRVIFYHISYPRSETGR